MIEIPLSHGLVALIDDEDVPLVEGRKWYAMKGRNTFYALSKPDVSGAAAIRMHRVITSAPQGQMVDHRDRNGLNNTRANLRLCSAIENTYNLFLKARNRTGYKGVSLDLKDGGYRAQIMVCKKTYRLGNFADPAEAARAYDAAARQHFGEFAYLNFPA